MILLTSNQYTGRHFGSSISPSHYLQLPGPPGNCSVAFPKMAAALTDSLNSVCASVVDAGYDSHDDSSDDPLMAAADVAVDALIAAAREAASNRSRLYAKVAADDADAVVVSRLAALGICGDAAISLIAGSVEAVADVAEEVLGAGHSSTEAAALQRIWLASSISGRRQLTELSRRLLPLSRLPPGTRATAVGRVPVTQSVPDDVGVRVAPPAAAATGKAAVLDTKSTAALTATTRVLLCVFLLPETPPKKPTSCPGKSDDPTCRPQKPRFKMGESFVFVSGGSR